ncbi:MAG: 5-(carboxyamino)imidazole ribonucleotide mutase [Limnochordaceae bacterium]|nr:5-(carboxyamino)imidazole ribonucleotide mutase [Limnochordaceae bacterium]
MQGEPRRTARVGLIMGSDSDWPVMKAAWDQLHALGIEVELAVASAHRTPERAMTWARTAAERGLRVIIAAAGGAAHLPGVMAAWTTLPVIGVPIAASLEGLDALLSIAQMPPGVPVAAVGINGARNAALLAAEILALSDPELTGRLHELRRRQADQVAEREQRLLQTVEHSPEGERP